MLLLDTNIWIEFLLGQASAEQAAALILRAPHRRLFLTDYTLHSICLKMHRDGAVAPLRSFLTDIVAPLESNVVTVPPRDLPGVLDIMSETGLDFDDAYQWQACRVHRLELVSFDRDFRRIGDDAALTPEQGLERLL